MKTLVALLILASTMSMNPFNFSLPKTWDKDFVITLDFHSSMSGGTTDLKFTYDSCVYTTESKSAAPETKFYRMTEKDRVAILNKLESLKIDKVEPKKTFVAVHDGWSQSICFGSHCIEGGTSVEMDEKDKNRFLEAYGYLEQFAIDKAKKMKKKR